MRQEEIKMNVKKRMTSLLIMGISLVFLSACSAVPMSESPVKTSTNEAAIELSIEELKDFDGQDGSKAYIAVDGKIYDVTDVEPWAGGVHQGKFPAGEDYTEKIKSESPHGLTPLDDLEPIGTLKK